MPFASKSQQRWMFSQHPAMAKRWAKETPDFKKLPEKKRRPRIKTKSKGRLKRGSADMPTIQTQLAQLHGELEKTSAYKLPAEKLASNLVVHLRFLAESLANPQPTIKLAAVLEETGNLRTALDQAFPAYTAEKKAALVMSLLRSLDQDMKKMALAQRIKSAIDKSALGVVPATYLSGAAVGAPIGAMLAPKGNRLEGTARGAVRGAHTAMGMGAGAGLGGLAGVGLGSLGDTVYGALSGEPAGGKGKAIGMVLGGLLGMGGGGYLGNKLTDNLLGDPSWEAKKEKAGEAMDMNMGEGMASPEDPMQMQHTGGQPQPGAPMADPTMAGAQPMMPPQQQMAPPQPMPPQVPGAVPPPPNDQPLPPQALQPTPPSPTDPAQQAMFAAQGMGGPGAMGSDPAAAIMSDPPDAISTDKMGSLQERLHKAALAWR